MSETATFTPELSANIEALRLGHLQPESLLKRPGRQSSLGREIQKMDEINDILVQQNQQIKQKVAFYLEMTDVAV